MLSTIATVMFLCSIVAFSFGVSFERDRQRWHKQAKRRSLGAIVLNTQKL